MSRSRCLGSRTRHFCRIPRNRAGVPAGKARQLTCWVRTAASVSLTDSPTNVRCPVSISYTTTPQAQMSARLSTGFPRACSGDM
jgi:hypothetical protein